jgi:hypothetical protein
MMTAPAFAVLSFALVSFCCVIPEQCRFFAARQGKKQENSEEKAEERSGIFHEDPPRSCHTGVAGGTLIEPSAGSGVAVRRHFEKNDFPG